MEFIYVYVVSFTYDHVEIEVSKDPTVTLYSTALVKYAMMQL